MDTNTTLNYQKWINEKNLDEQTKIELFKMKDDEAKINDRFYKDLSFGTGGLRGIIGVGSNRMNIYTVRKASQGLANYLLKSFDQPSCSIAYDSRNYSKEFAYQAAKVLSSNGVKVYLYETLEPTPVLSFTVRYLNTNAGIVITASHNPAEYNGYKVYGEDGCQITDALASKIYQEIQRIDIFKDIKLNDDSNINYIGEDILKKYYISTLKQSIFKSNRQLKIIYTPLNGAGLIPVTTILNMDGFNNVLVVEEQKLPDGNFPTIPYPNPEYKNALDIGVNYLNNNNFDILIATDPDSDRVGLVCKDYLGIHYFTGNEVGILLFDFLLNHHQKENGVIIKTIVTSDLINIIAKDYNIEVKEVLTGFKYIGEQIKYLESDNRLDDFILGLEESCGYLTNTDVRDKDAVNASMLIAELSEELYSNNSSPYIRLQEIYRKYGKYITKTLSYELKGSEGAKRINQLMEDFRNNKLPLPVLNPKISNDYLLSVSHTPTGDVEIKLPKSNVLKYIYDNGDTLTIRPSGTEPKIKIYVFSKEEQTVNQIEQYFNELIK